MKVIGITGGIGSGKSTAAEFLARLGAKVLDADKLAHQLYKPGAKLEQKLISAFGEKILTSGKIDRGKLAQVAFSTPEGWKRLNQIVHPELFLEVKKILEGWREEGVRVAVVEAALLFEAGWEDVVDEVWVIFAPQEKVLERLKNKFSPEQIEMRSKAQLPVEEKVCRADVLIDNSGDLEQLKKQIIKEWHRLVL